MRALKMSELNIPVPDPSDKTMAALREAVLQAEHLVNSRLQGAKDVIEERFKSIDRRLSDRDATLVTATAAQKENVATALAAVIEEGKSRTTRFDLLERRVAALELAISGSLGKVSGTGLLASGFAQAVATAAAVLAAIVAYASFRHG
jgi:UDP-N-acetylmuramate-alanine ligase